MPHVTSYRHGVPAWIDVSAPDIDVSAEFYLALFGWEAGPDLGPDAGGYRLFLLDGVNVAGVGPTTGDAPPAWSTYIAVDDVGVVAANVAALGGTLVVPPMELPNDSGRIAFGIDPTGAFFGMFEAGPNHRGSEIANEVGAITWHELNTRDAPAAATFYDALFGWTTQPMPGSDMGYWLVDVGGRSVAGVMPMDDSFPPEVPSNWLPYFAVVDAQAAADHCVALGGSAMGPAFDTPVGPMAVLADPAGAVFAVGAFTQPDDPNAWPE
jgi:uncharacterized protein